MGELIKSIKIDHAKIVDSISYQIQSIFTNKSYREYFGNVKLVTVDDEQNFVPRDDYENSIFLVVHFGDSSIDYATSACAIVIKVLGSENTFEPARNLLTLFATEYNMQYLNYDNSGKVAYDESIIQTWNAPVVLQNFIDLGDDFRNFLNLTGTYIIVSNSDNKMADLKIDGIKYNYTDSDGEHSDTVNYLSFNDSLTNSLDPQPFYSSNGRTQSISKFVTYAFTISIYPINSQLITDVFTMMGFNNDGETDENKTFNFTLTMNNDMKKTSNYKLQSVDRRKSDRGTLSILTLSFAE